MGGLHNKDSTIPGEIISSTTLVCASIEWQISGDENQNCTVEVGFREKGSQRWYKAQPLLRCEPGTYNKYQIDPGNLLAGSILNLSPDTSYEILLSLNDPDGGEAQQIVTVVTRTEPKVNKEERILHIVPGNGGGIGTKEDPFRGLLTADAIAEPGDVFLLGPGIYRGTFTATKDGIPGMPIVYRGIDEKNVILDGEGEEKTLDFSNRKYLFLENVTAIKGNNIVIDASNGQGIVIRRCKIDRCLASTTIRNPIGICAQGDSRDIFISDNEIKMCADWEGKGRTGGGFGISINGIGHIICHNHIMDCWDAISLASNDHGKTVTKDIDIYGNFIERAVDDGVECDYVRHNIRVFKNRILNSGSALSSQPCFGGPTYYLYNEIFNCRIKPYKYHVTPTGMIAFHNTSFSSRAGWNGGDWRNVKHRNNLILGNLSPTVATIGIKEDLDYNGYNRCGETLIQLLGESYKTLEEFAAVTGNEAHGIEVTLDDFIDAILPHHPEWTYKEQYGRPYEVGEVDLRLRPESKAIDRGEVLPNINDDFIGNAPDLGCYELGRPLPYYGPR